MDPKLIDNFIKTYLQKNVDYLTNILFRTFPDGLDIEIFNKKSLVLAQKIPNILLIENMSLLF